MTTPHQAGRIPWHCLTDHVDFSDTSMFPTIDRVAELEFKYRPSSTADARAKSFLHFARTLSSRIVEFAETRRALVPLPDEWSTKNDKLVTVVDNALFPRDMLRQERLLPFTSLPAWEDIDKESDEAALVVILVLSTPQDPFQYLPALLRAAQHARISFHHLQSVYTSGNGDPGVTPYAKITLEFYLYVNLMVALGVGHLLEETPSLVERRLSGGFSFYWQQVDGLHRIWGPPGIVEQLDDLGNADNRAAYSYRCFKFVVAWYAIFREAHERNCAIGLSMFTFGEDDLTQMILNTLASMSSVFHIEAFHDDPLQFLYVPRPGPPPTTSGATPSAPPRTRNKSRPQSKWVTLLPTEILIYIASFLPPRALLSLVSVCRQMRNVSTPILYSDPLNAVVLPHGIYAEEVASKEILDRLLGVLSSRPDLTRMVRKVEIPPGDIDRMLHFPNLQQLTIFESNHHPTPSGCILEKISRSFPFLTVLKFRPPYENSFIHWCDEPCIPNSVAWRNLTCLKVTGLLQEGVPAFRQLIALVASSLASLHISAEMIPIEDVASFPVCPKVQELVMSIEHSPNALLARCFPSVKTLSITDPDARDIPYDLDLSRTAPLAEHVHLSNIAGHVKLPDSIRTLSCECSNRIPSIVPSQHVTALACSWWVGENTFFESFGNSCGASLRSLEMQFYWPPLDVHVLPALADVIERDFPSLEVLIVTLRSLSYRPRRTDYPVDDGIDEVQRHHASMFFETCPTLNAISFNGVPDEEEPAGKFPGRVWVRVVDENAEDEFDFDVVMKGRAALPWKLTEFWEKRVHY